jgi:hypothetical protein
MQKKYNIKDNPLPSSGQKKINKKIINSKKTKRIHSVLVYKIQSTTACINRDINAVNNMKKIINYMILYGVRPKNYCRTQKNIEDIKKIYSKEEIERQMKQEALRKAKIIN